MLRYIFPLAIVKLLNVEIIFSDQHMEQSIYSSRLLLSDYAKEYV